MRPNLLHAHLRRRPDDLPAWVDLAHHVARGAPLPRELGAEALPWIRRAWGWVPEDRALGALALPLLGLRALALDGPPGAYWERHGRGRDLEGVAWDGVTGFPLRVRDPARGVEYRLVAPRVELGDEADRWHPPFYLTRFPVTVAEYRRFVVATGYREPIDYLKLSPFPVQLRRERRPVVFVSGVDAGRFAAWADGRLPGVGEWRHAARGDDARTYPWGEEAPDLARTNANFGRPWRGGDWDRYLVEVGSWPAGAGPFGVEGQAGNVREWTRDLLPEEDCDELLVTALADARAERGKRVLLGGSWAARDAADLGVDATGPGLAAPSRSDDVGFRVVKEI